MFQEILYKDFKKYSKKKKKRKNFIGYFKVLNLLCTNFIAFLKRKTASCGVMVNELGDQAIISRSYRVLYASSLVPN